MVVYTGSRVILVYKEIHARQPGYLQSLTGKTGLIRILHIMADEPHSEIERFFGLLVTSLHDSKIRHLLVASRSQNLEAYSHYDIDILTLPYGRLFDLWASYTFKRAIKRFEPDIVLSWTRQSTSWYSRIKSKGMAAVHCAWASMDKSVLPYRGCDYIISGSKPIIESFSQAGWPLEKLRYLPIFIDDISAEPIPRSQFSTPKDAPLLLAVGPLCEEQGFDILIRAAADLPHAYVWIIGEGPLHKTLEDLAIEVGVRPRVRFLGKIEERAPYFKAADILVCPFRAEYLNSAIFEAWAQKTPVIAATSDGPGSLIKHDKTGVLFKTDDCRDLTQTLKRFFLNPGLRRDLTEQGRKIYEKSYSPPNGVARFSSFFKEIASPSPINPGKGDSGESSKSGKSGESGKSSDSVQE